MSEIIDNPFCRLYVYSSEGFDSFYAQVVAVLSDIGHQPLASGCYIDTEHLEIRVKKSEDHDPVRVDREDDFIYYPFYVEIDQVDGVALSSYIGKVDELVQALRSPLIRVVASCQFEEELTDSGYGLG